MIGKLKGKGAKMGVARWMRAPNGVVSLPSEKQLTDTVPALSRRAPGLVKVRVSNLVGRFRVHENEGLRALGERD